MDRLIIKDTSPSDKLDIRGINLYTDSDMTRYALYILHNDVITPQEWVKRFKK